MEIEALVRQNIRAMKPYSSARDEFSGSAAIFLDANENPYGDGLNRYPDPYQRDIKRSIAALKAVEPARIFIGNGSDEPIDLLIRIFCEPGQDSILTIDPTYGMYAVAAAINDVKVIKAPLREDFTLDAGEVLNRIDDSVKIIFLCSPNNPSGNLLDKGEIIRILDNFKGIIVIDEAYIDFAEDEGFLHAIDTYPRLVILQTFSKAWGLAGLRAGIAYASIEIIHYLNKVKPPYNINALTQRELLKALRNRQKVAEEVNTLITQRRWLEEKLRQHELVEMVYPSDSNFILVRFRAAPAVFSYLIKKGIIVRDRSSVLHAGNCLRITVGTPEENEQLINALEDFKPL